MPSLYGDSTVHISGVVCRGTAAWIEIFNSRMRNAKLTRIGPGISLFSLSDEAA